MLKKIISNIGFMFQILNMVCKTWFLREPYEVLFMAPDYRNVGDLLIAYAEKQIIMEADSKTKLIEIPSRISRNFLSFYRHLVKGHTIYITGGGYLGTPWFCYEENVRRIIQAFPENPIMIFPQTIYFENTDWGNKQKQLTKEVFDAHGHITLCMREKYSFQIAEELFNNVKVLLIPDMVTFLNVKVKSETRQGAVICMRSDSERYISDAEQKMVIEELSHYFSTEEIEFKDTVQPGKIKSKERENLIQFFFSYFSSHRIVITDRLHGMVLAAITGTPCIAFDNINYKIRGVYEWIKNNRYIHYLESTDDFKNTLKQCMDTEKLCQYENSDLQIYREQLVREIQD